MDTKLKIITALLLTSGLFSCKPKQLKVSSQEEGYVLAYKRKVLYSCINSKTNKELYQLLEKYNGIHSYSDVEILSHGIAEQAGKKGQEYAKNMKPVYMPDVDGRLPIFRDCVSYAFSKEIDSIAKIEYKKAKNGKYIYIYE